MCNETAIATAMPAVPTGNVWVSDIIGEDFKSWENGRVILDCGTGRGKNEFIIKKLASWLVDEMLTKSRRRAILYLCPLTSLHAEMIRRRFEAEIAEMGEEVAAEFPIYKEILITRYAVPAAYPLVEMIEFDGVS